MGAEVSKGKYSKMGSGLQQQSSTDIQEENDQKSELKNGLNGTQSKHLEEPTKNSTNDKKDDANFDNDLDDNSQSGGTTIEKLKKGVIAKMNSNYEEIPTEDSN